jgi:hypothetical protein
LQFSIAVLRRIGPTIQKTFRVTLIPFSVFTRGGIVIAASVFLTTSLPWENGYLPVGIFVLPTYGDLRIVLVEKKAASQPTSLFDFGNNNGGGQKKAIVQW